MTTETDWKDLPTIQDVAKAQADGWEIENGIANGWSKWREEGWSNSWSFRGRPRQPKMKEVKMLCWRETRSGSLAWRQGSVDWTNAGWQRFPAGDLTGEVVED